MRTIKQFLLAACGLACIAAFVVHADSAAALEKAIGAIRVGGPTSPDGQAEVTCDLPVSERKQNIASKGLGCCVFRSMDHAARWQGVPQLVGFPEWMMKKGIPGGGYPAKVKELIERISKDRGMEAPGYLQYEGKNPSILREAIASGRMPGVTYNGHDPHYAGTIAHMVNLVHLDDRRACILDNNFIGDNELVWMTPQEFFQRWTGGGNGWTAILINPPPPPPPHNAKE